MSHLQTTRNPMSEARRAHVHGPLVDAYSPRRDFLALAILLPVLAVAAVFAIVILTPASLEGGQSAARTEATPGEKGEGAQ